MHIMSADETTENPNFALLVTSALNPFIKCLSQKTTGKGDLLHTDP